MLQVFLGLTPFIGITLLGFLLGKVKIFDLQKAKYLNLFLFYIAVPALIIKIVAQSVIGQIDIAQIGSYFMMQSLCGVFAFYLTNKIFNRSIKEAIIWALTVALSNHVILILPIAEIFFEGNTIIQISSIILMDSVVLISIISFFLELTTKKKIKLLEFFKNLSINPMILSILIGLLIKSLNLSIDDTPVEYVLERLALCVMPVGLFAIGITLSYYTSRVINSLTLSISIIKLIISPLILFLFGFIIFKVSDLTLMTGALLVSVGPCGATSIMMCSAYDVSPENIIKAIFISTFASIFTILFLINLISS